MNRPEMVNQTRMAFDYLQKMYLEVSYLIKEIEGQLFEEDEKFVICKASGYAISTRSSSGLESPNVAMWLTRKLAVSFVPEERTKLDRGQTLTDINGGLKVFHTSIVLDDPKVSEPSVFSGVLYNIHQKLSVKWIKKFENIMAHIEYNREKVFKDPENVEHEDAYIKLSGKFVRRNLFDINNSEAIVEHIIKPALLLYRGVP
ncbi:MAG TPA: hypothetical protein VGJ94_19010 [Syntrophorhabdaceae bacterium]